MIPLGEPSVLVLSRYDGLIWGWVVSIAVVAIFGADSVSHAQLRLGQIDGPGD
jgi:hypothetical protein